MSAGRPGEGVKHVERLAGDETGKHRLRVILETLSGERSIEQACAELGVSASRFHELRHEALQGALDALAPGAAGRPARQVDALAEAERARALERDKAELEVELQAALVRTEIALAMPHVLTSAGRAEIKKKARKARKRPRKRSGGAGSGT